MTEVSVFTPRQMFVGRQFPLPSWPCASVSREHASSDYLGRYVVTTTYTKKTKFSSCRFAAPSDALSCGPPMSRSGKKRSRTFQDLQRGIKNFSLLCPLGLLKLFPQKGGSVEAKSKIWDLQMVLVHPTCHTQDLRQPIVLPLRERELP